MQWTYEGKEIDIIPDEYEGLFILLQIPLQVKST